MNKSIEKIVAKLGPVAATKYGPAIGAFLATNPWLIPVVLLGGIGIAALIEMVEEGRETT